MNDTTPLPRWRTLLHWNCPDCYVGEGWGPRRYRRHWNFCHANRNTRL